MEAIFVIKNVRGLLWESVIISNARGATMNMRPDVVLA